VKVEDVTTKPSGNSTGDGAIALKDDPSIATTPAGLTVLLVDDDADCRSLVRDAISETGGSGSVVEVTDGMSALTYLHESVDKNGRPGLIFLDVEMPRMDGLETLRRIKEDPRLRDIPVVMLTGVSEEIAMQRAAEYGANSYTVKPADAEAFLRTIMASTNYWLTVHRSPKQHKPCGEVRNSDGQVSE